MVSTEGYIILGFFISILIVVLLVMLWPQSKHIKEFYKKMGYNPYGVKVIVNAPTIYTTYDGEIINERNMIRIGIKGDGLYYKGIRDGYVGLVDVSCKTFEKGNVILITDWTLWEIKTCHKNGNYTLTKEKDGKKITKRIKYDEIGGRLKYCF